MPATLTDTTLALLQQYLPADAAESKYLERMLTLADVDDGFDREHFTPGHFTASAFVLSPDSTQLLLILHGKLGLWLQPGGHVESNDATITAAATREILEETGLGAVDLVQAAPIDLDIHVIPARKEMPEHEHFDVRFLFRARSDQHHAQSDALAARWVALHGLDGLQTDESVMRAVRKIQTLLTP
jgi:8-oxo-dGTP pyrophosphatase MutT (NUDIX family)